MELVYLWVKKYKNIENQGFNFSPRFECKYDKDTSKLDIIDKEETGKFYPKNFFGENINVTAIVGENGSGKSSVLEAMVQIQSKDYNDILGFLILVCDDNLYIIDRKKIKYDKKKIKNFNPFSSDKKSLFVKRQFLTLWMDALNSYAIKNSNKLQVILQTNSLFYQFNQNDIENKHYELSQEINLSKILEEEYYFDSFEITLKNISVDYKDYWKEYNGIENQKLLNFIDNIHPRTFDIDDFRFVIAHNYYIATIRFFLKHWQKATNIPNCNFNSLFMDFIMNINSQLNITTEELLDLTIDFNLNIQEKLDKDSDFSPSVNILVLKYAFLSIILKNITLDYQKKESNFMHSKFHKIYKFNSNKKIKDSIDSIKHFIGLEEDWLEFNFFDIDIINKENGNKYSTLSDGERQLLNISLDLLYSLKNSKNYGMNQIIIFDEADSFLHPKWSKTLLYKLKKVIENYNNLTKNNVNLHLLLSTHSPSLLSDLPKENVIFLEKGKQVYPFEDGKQTFGANIHTLLSHGFFMEDGLMGEFAKEKITEIKKFYDENKNLQKEDANFQTQKDDYEAKEHNFRYIQSIIGEAFLKTIMKNYLDELELLFSDDEDLINKELEELEKRKLYLEKLKNAKD
ncbi:MAG: AAA family ATPase [Sulfurimonas sp.]|jgi:predicted ATP-binding protein involved in virulence